jgi:hypothetical protein
MSPALPGQQDVAPVGAPAWQTVVQQMSPALNGQAVGGFALVPVHVPATQPPVVVLQKAPAAFPEHSESVVHFPHMFAVVTPQSGPAELAPVQSASVRQLPGEHTPARHRYPLPPPSP